MKRILVLAVSGLVLGFVAGLIAGGLHLEAYVAGLQFLVAAFLASAAGVMIQQKHGDAAVNVFLGMGAMIDVFTLTFACAALPLVSLGTGYLGGTSYLLYIALGVTTLCGGAGAYVANRCSVGARMGQFLLVSVVGAILGVGVLMGAHLEVVYFIGDFVARHSTLGPAVHFSLLTAMLAAGVGVVLRHTLDRA